MKKASTFSLNNQLFNSKTVNEFVWRVEQAYPALDASAFQEKILAWFPERALKERIERMAVCLHDYLPDGFAQASQIILNALPKPLNPSLTDNDFGKFHVAPFATYVELYGLEDRERSRELLKQITMRFSIEFSVRAFINKHPDWMLEQFTKLATSPNYHQRRLVSEWSRPLLPRASRIPRTYEQTLPLLDLLYTDPTRYVTRSVANHLNDISKNNPDIVIQTLKRRTEEGKQTPTELERMKRHALRTLLKQWDPQALNMMWYTDPSHIQVHDIHASSTVRIGDAFELSWTLLSTQWVLWTLLVTYSIGYLKKLWTRNETVYKIFTGAIDEDSYQFTKRQPMRLMTTRALYPWLHTWSISVNGIVTDEGEFELVE